ncbi:MAG: ATP-binding protein [Limnobacter sp.]|nr:ATP-binding protein [Limnobacter sp.]
MNTNSTISRQTGHKNMLHLIHLRWMALLGQILTLLIATLVLGISLPMLHIVTVLVLLTSFNIGSHLRWHEEQAVSNTELFLALLVDVASLTALLYFTGGIKNPFAFLYLLQVILSAVLLRPASTWSIVFITTGCLGGLSVYHEPLILPLNSEYQFPGLYEQGLLLCFAINAALLVFFISRISANLRAGDAYLASLQQRAVEEEHIVRMGLLASGAAHELGTPMATMSVILGDWKHLPEVKSNTELQEDIAELQTQLLRCKSIVSGILMTAGEARGESSSSTQLEAYLNDLVDEWRETRPNGGGLSFSCTLPEGLEIAFDSTIQQMIFNVLDNALEASPKSVEFTAQVEGDSLTLMVADQGAGFKPEILENIGKPYNSSKGRPGGGLGMFLVMNVARTLGGTVKAWNREEGGAVVRIEIPLNSIVLENGQA